jgi:hypothetical protein
MLKLEGILSELVANQSEMPILIAREFAKFFGAANQQQWQAMADCLRQLQPRSLAPIPTLRDTAVNIPQATNLLEFVVSTDESTMAPIPGSTNMDPTSSHHSEEQESQSANEEGAAIAAAVFNAPAHLEAEDVQPPPHAVVQSLPQSPAESADAAVQSCPAGVGMIDVSLLLVQEFTLVMSSKVWDPGGIFSRRCHGGRACDKVAPQEAQRSYANNVV